jgi:hypothetical protein
MAFKIICFGFNLPRRVGPLSLSSVDDVAPAGLGYDVVKNHQIGVAIYFGDVGRKVQ